MPLPLEVKQFLSENREAILATSSNSSAPYLTPLFYIVNDYLQVVFTSHKDTQKIKNIQSNPQCGLIITDWFHQISLQIHGAGVVEDKQNTAVVSKLLQVANTNSKGTIPPLLKLQNSSTYVTVLLTPQWYKYTNYSQESPIILEGKV